MRPRLRAAARGVLVALFCAGLAGGLVATGILDSADQAAADALPAWAPVDPRILVVGLDDRYRSDPDVPEDDYGVAELIERLGAMGAEVITFDEELYNEDPGPAGAVADAVRRAGNVVVTWQAVPDRVALAAAAVTSESPVADLDGVARASQLVAPNEFEPRGFPSLALATVILAEELPTSIGERRGEVAVGPKRIPIGERQHWRERSFSQSPVTGFDMTVSFANALLRPRGDHYLSAADVLGSAPTPTPIAGRIVLIGSIESRGGNVVQPFVETVRTPRSASTPSVLLNANAVNTILTGHFVTTASPSTTFLVATALALLAAAASWRLRAWLAPLAFLVLAGGAVGIGLVLWRTGYIVALVSPLVAAAFACVSVLTVRLVGEARERRRISDVLSQYVPAPVARELLARSREAGLASVSITFVLTDIVGSTRGWEEAPESMRLAIARHDEITAEVIEANGGWLIRPRGEGDSRFGVFAEPAAAARASLELQHRLASEAWATPFPIQVRAGLHTGEADSSSGDHYGSPVNRCARIRSLAAPGQTLASEALADAVRGELAEAELRDRGMHQLEGLTNPEHVYELVTKALVPAAAVEGGEL